MPRIPATSSTTGKDTVRIYYANVGRMGTANRDASLVTAQKRNVAINSYASDWYSATITSTTPNKALAKPGATGAEIISQIYSGCEECTNISKAGSDPNVGPYAFGRGPNASTSR
jgi:hypothetical protein